MHAPQVQAAENLNFRCPPASRGRPGWRMIRVLDETHPRSGESKQPLHNLRRVIQGSTVSIALIFLLAACDDATTAPQMTEAPVRGLVTTIVKKAEQSTRRRFPGVLEPTDITSISFEVAGKLENLDLQVGQRVKKDDVLAQLDDTQFQADVESQIASVAESNALLEQAEDNLKRQQKLFEERVASKVTLDNAETDVRTNKANLTKSERALDNARKDLSRTTLRAPFDGIINSVDAESFQTVSIGSKITSIYNAASYEVSFSVNFVSVSQLVVGTPAIVRLADDPAVELKAVVSELGERADSVSSYPIVVKLQQAHPLIRAGMAVEVSLEFKLPTTSGYLVPLSAAITDKNIGDDANPNTPTPLEVYVFDPETSTVKRRGVTMAGMRENQFLIIDGLQPGERVATAGVSFLREGMRVKLIEATD